MEQTNIFTLSESLFQDSGNNLKAAFLQNILNNIHESILIIDTMTRVVFVNESYLKMFQVKRERIIGHHLDKFEPLARIHEVLRTKQAINSDISYIHSADISVYADMMPLFWNGRLVGALALMKDITEQIQNAQEAEHFKSLTEQLKNELSAKDDLPQPFHRVIGQDPKFVNMLHIAAKAAQSEASICITGESGSGKEVLAEAIHYSSPRSAGPLIKINCAAIPETLLESELFGYESGAFTGARSGGKPGKFELAAGGTVFLDEIGEMPLSMQVKLLRVLQERKVERIGGRNSITLDFRLITATNRNLEEMISDGTFREDLYYRINVIGLNIPPLRERVSDIETFAQLFLDDLRQQYQQDYLFSDDALFALTNYNWPGNVRELKNYVERAAILSYGNVITADLLPARLRQGSSPAKGDDPETYDLHTLLEQTEKNAISTALRMSGGNKTHAIEILGISRRSFYQKLEKYGLLTDDIKN